MKLKILILLCACFVAQAQQPPPTPSINTNRSKLNRALRNLGTNVPALSIAVPTNLPALSIAFPTNANGNLPPAPPAPITTAIRPRTNALAAPVQPATPTQPSPQPDQTIAVVRTNLTDIPNPDEIIQPGTINFPAVDINQVLPIYAELVNRTILRASTLPAAPITLKTQTPLTKREAIDALNAVLGMNGIAMVNIGEKFVKAVPSVQGGTIGAKLNRDDPSTFGDLGGYVTHVTQLKFAKPTELVPILQPFASAGIGAAGIQAIDSSLILVLRDYTENIKRMLELIKELDIVPTAEFVSEVIPIKYALASDISAALNGLSSGSSGTTIGQSSGRALPGAAGGGVPGTTYPGGGLNQPGSINRNPSTLGGAGAPGGAAAPSFSERLRGIISSAQRATGGGDFQILGQTKIIADSRTNSLLIFASKQDMAMIKDIISKLDVVLAQVLIEAIIMEVSLEDLKQVGFSYVQGHKATTVGSFTGAGGINNVPFLTPGNFSLNAEGTNGITANKLPNGFSYVGSLGQDLDVTMQALATDSRVNVLSRPRIQTSHAVPASLFIGNTVPYITGTSFNDFGGVGARSQYQEKRIGITLDVLPLINPDGLVVMDIQQNIQQLGVDKIIDGNPVPTTTERSASAKVAVRDRDTIILGGFISSSKTKSKSGVPLLQDIPLLGYLFRSSTDKNQRVELIVMMRPTVLPTPEAASIAATAERDKLPGIHRAQIEYEKDAAQRLKQFESGYRKEIQQEKEKDQYKFEPVDDIKQ